MFPHKSRVSSPLSRAALVVAVLATPLTGFSTAAHGAGVLEPVVVTFTDEVQIGGATVPSTLRVQGGNEFNGVQLRLKQVGDAVVIRPIDDATEVVMSTGTDTSTHCSPYGTDEQSVSCAVLPDSNIWVKTGAAADEVQLYDLTLDGKATIELGGASDYLDMHEITMDSTVYGGTGDDYLRGGFGDDTFVAQTGPDGADARDGRLGNDTVSYAGRLTNVTVDLNNEFPNAEGDTNKNVENAIGGYGNDLLIGANYFDVGVSAPSPNNILSGGPGNDTLQGGDIVAGSDPDDDGRDTFWGGPGTDLVTYVHRSTPLTVDVDNAPDDGAPGEGDNVHSDVENITGGSGDDRLTGRASIANRLQGGAGTDVLDGVDGDGVDNLQGGSQPTGTKDVCRVDAPGDTADSQCETLIRVYS
ncbi:hypothetical protein O3S80_48435 [Streptomyces sp. Lzd4kr]|nr:hypothetical protein [Streptomyces sp. Lzd4kr]